ncbi:MAG: hypothetical protein AAFU70_01725, partial [Planctomycetota bacterium]
MTKTSLTVGLLLSAGLHAALFLVTRSERAPSEIERAIGVAFEAPPPLEAAAFPEDARAAETEKPAPKPEPIPEVAQAEPDELLTERAEVRGEADGAETGDVAVDNETETLPADEIAEAEPLSPVEEFVREARAESEAQQTALETAQSLVDDLATRMTDSTVREPVERATANPEASEPAASAASTAPPLRGDPDAMPPILITWRSPAEAQRVARRLGLRIVAVNEAGETLGQVSTVGRPSLIPLERDGDAGPVFSNRARVIDDPLFFGSGVRDASGGSIAGFWILVPPSIDRSFEREAKRAIAAAGVRTGDVIAVEAGFEALDGRD